MTLSIVSPYVVTDANITASNVGLEPEWVAGTYTLGEQRRVGERLYEVSAETTTQEPGQPLSSEWFDAGPANRYAAFDTQFGADKYRVVETFTSRPESVEFTLDDMPRFTSISMFGLRATFVTVSASLDGIEVWTETFPIRDGVLYLGSLWRWAFLPSRIETRFTRFGLDVPRGATVSISIMNDDGDARVGSVVMGIERKFGVVGSGSSRSLKSRSIKRTEGTLTSLLRRTPSSRVTYDIMIEKYGADAFWAAVEDLDGMASLFTGPDENRELVVYGFITSCQTVSEVFGQTKVQLEVETL